MAEPVTWEEIASEIRGEFRSVPSAAGRAAAHRNAIQVLEDTRVWRAVPRHTQLVPGRYVYSFQAPEHADVVELSAVQMLTRQEGVGPLVDSLRPIEVQEAFDGRHGIPRGWPDTDDAGRGAPVAYMEWQTEAGERCFAVAPTPDDEWRRELRLTCVFSVGARARGLPPAVYVRIRLALRHAVLWDVFSQRDQPWGSETRSAYHQQQYVARANKLRASAGLAAKRRRGVLGGHW